MSEAGKTDEVGMLLSGVNILQDLEQETIRDIARSVVPARFRQGEKLIELGQTSDRLYIIFSGEVEVLIPDIVRQVDRKVTLSEGSIIGEISLLTDNPYSADVLAVSDTSVLYLDRENFNRLIEQHKSFAETMTNLVSERMALNGGINQVGHYHLLNKLGMGNMAIVFNAYDSQLERDVAIKMLKYELSHDPEFLERFEQEARTIAGLTHPNIVNVYEVIDEFSTRFMVMEKLVGKNIAEVIKQDGPFGIVQTREILYQVASALQYAHTHGEKGIIHRDIKPSNIIINANGHVKLTDFGIAGPPMQNTDTIEGTPHYLAPEIINSQAADGRADIYAMGIMAFYMLTGSPPFTASSVGKVLDMHLNQQPPDIRNYRPDIDDDMVAFIEKSLEKDVDRRIHDWNLIKVLLKPGSRRDNIVLHEDDIVFVTRLHNTSYQQAALIIHAMKQQLEDAEIDHFIEMQKSNVSY